MRFYLDNKGLVILYLVTGGFVLAGAIAPFATIIVDGLFAPARPSGFGQDSMTLFMLARRSLLLSIIPAALATLLGIAASCIASLHLTFRTFYRRWIYTVLFTNPVFMVLGMTVLLNRMPPEFAVTLASWLVLMPLVALPIQAAAEQAPANEMLAARALGAGTVELVRLHLIPAIGNTAIGALGLGTVFALGFYLLPSFVGYGQTPTLGVAIDTAVNRLGDNGAAAQLGILLVSLEICISVSLLTLVAIRMKWRQTYERQCT